MANEPIFKIVGVNEEKLLLQWPQSHKTSKYENVRQIKAEKVFGACEARSA